MDIYGCMRFFYFDCNYNSLLRQPTDAERKCPYPFINSHALCVYMTVNVLQSAQFMRSGITLCSSMLLGRFRGLHNLEVLP